jgi:hypothetical protein
MPVYVDKMTTDVAVVEGELPLSKKQLDSLVELVLARLKDAQREDKRRNEATQIRSRAARS